jgi:pyruvate/2-oxoglutarate dehydrogenase complex dihydrolipoamide dehydrogenase (E3) component
VREESYGCGGNRTGQATGHGPILLPSDRHNHDLLANVHPAAWTNPAPAQLYDMVVLGAGTAGLVCAAGAAGLGARVALVERHLMGGDCLNFGCVPSKAVLRAAKAWHAAAAGASFGAPIASGDGDSTRAMERMRSLRAAISGNDSAERFRRLGVDVFLGAAHFVDAGRVSVDGTELRFRRAVIATGARAAVPPIPGLSALAYRTNETIFELESVPPRLAILGAGPIGCEMAQAFARMGSRVTLVDRESRILPRDDADAAAAVTRSLERDGVKILCAAAVTGVAARGTDKTLIVSAADRPAAEIVVDELLVATGRAANVEGLELERAGVAYDADGVRVDTRLRTSNRRIFACGDVTGRFQFTHAADACARVVIQNALFLGRARSDRLVIPWCTYTDPELAHVGMGASAAASTAGAMTLTIPYGEVDRARIDGADDGFLRIHVARRSGRILGATVVGARAGETIGQISLAMTAGVTLGKIAAAVYPYPSYGEALKKAADAWRRTKLTPAAKRFLRLIGYLGTRT